MGVLGRRGLVLFDGGFGDESLHLLDALGATLFPALVGMPAEVAGAGQDAVGVEAGLLVERDGVGRMGGAKDVTAVAAVMTTEEQTERGAAGGRIAGGRRRVGLDGDG